MEKIKALKVKLKAWNKGVFGNVDEQKKSTLKNVALWDDIESQRPLSDGERQERMGAMEDFKKWVIMEEISWRQKLREIWLKEGDRNTGIFHKMANSHKKRNNIDRIRIGDQWLTGTKEAKLGIAKAFKELLGDPGDWRASLEGLNFSRLNDMEALRLEVPFTEDEIHVALADLNGDKAPRPDGFKTAFWQFGWDVKSDIMGLFRYFHEHGIFIRSLNSTFMVLIPKRGGVEDLKDFRPISLTGSIYKLIAKVLANRLKKVMNKLVNSAQNAFVEGRQILDASLIANEVIDSMLKKKEKWVLCKLDIKKAYDKINWNFLSTMLGKMVFKEKW